MIIRELKIRNFGKFHNKEITFQEGINLIYGENESGKSTLHAFIRGMLFGVSRLRGRAAATDAYSRYEPWESSIEYGGGIRFEVEGRRFFLSRGFQKGSRENRLICEDDGEVLSLENGDLTMLLGGISEVAYDNTVSVGQLKARTGEGLAAELRDYVAGYQGGMDGSLNLKKALNDLKQQKREAEEIQKEAQKEQRKKQEALCGKINYVREELGKLREELSEKESKVQKKHTGNSVYAGCAAVFLTAVCLWQFHVVSVWLAAFLAAAVLLLTVGYYRNKSREEQAVSGDKKLELKWEQQLVRFEEEYKNLCNKMQEESQSEKEAEALTLALETISELSQKMQKNVGNGLRKRVSVIISELTQGCYKQVNIGEDFAPTLYRDGRQIPLHQVSIGTVEQVYFAFRLAAEELLGREEHLPVILDDTFVMYDEKRLEQALCWLGKNCRQVLIFTCQKREGEILKKLGIPWNGIILE